jgi:heat shock protein HslJ
MKRLGLITALLLTACLGSDFGDSVEGNWILESGSGDGGPLPIVDTHPITMALDGSSISGTAACNSYGGAYRVSSTGNFQLVDGVAVTEMACDPPEAMESEAAYLEALSSADKIAINEGRLTLTGGGYELNYVTDPDAPPAAAPGTEDPEEPVSSVEWFGPETYGDWVLVSGTADGVPIPMVDTHPITLSLDETGFGGTSACNGYGFALPLPEDGSFPPIVSTMMLCDPPEVMDSEAAYTAALQRYQSASIVGEQLVIVGDGVELIYDPA